MAKTNLNPALDQMLNRVPQASDSERS